MRHPWRVRPVLAAVGAAMLLSLALARPAAAAVPAAVTPNGPNGVTIGDVNGDGLADLLARTPGGDLQLYQAAASLSHPYPTSRTVGTSWQNFNWFLAGDITGDGFADIVAESPDGSISLYPNTRNGAAPYINNSYPVGSSWQNFTHVAIGDVNCDGYADLIATTADGTLTLYETNPFDLRKPFDLGAQSIGSSWQNYNRIFLGDINADGCADILATTPGGDLYEYLNQAGGGAWPPYSPSRKIGSSWQGSNRVLAGDVVNTASTPYTSGDRRADIVATHPDGALWLYPDNRNSTDPFSDGGYQIGSGWQNFG